MAGNQLIRELAEAISPKLTNGALDQGRVIGGAGVGANNTWNDIKGRLQIIQSNLDTLATNSGKRKTTRTTQTNALQAIQNNIGLEYANLASLDQSRERDAALNQLFAISTEINMALQISKRQAWTNGNAGPPATKQEAEKDDEKRRKQLEDLNPLKGTLSSVALGGVGGGGIAYCLGVMASKQHAVNFGEAVIMGALAGIVIMSLVQAYYSRKADQEHAGLAKGETSKLEKLVFGVGIPVVGLALIPIAAAGLKGAGNLDVTAAGSFFAFAILAVVAAVAWKKHGEENEAQAAQGAQPNIQL